MFWTPKAESINKQRALRLIFDYIEDFVGCYG
jgi:hypothetical protein